MLMTSYGWISRNRTIGLKKTSTQSEMGAAAFEIAFILSGRGCNPRLSILWPEYYLTHGFKLTFVHPQLRQADSSLCRIDCRVDRYSSFDEPVNRISSKYTTTFGMSFRRFSMVCWKIPSADYTPKWRWLYLNSPQWVLMTTYCLEFHQLKLLVKFLQV